LPFEAYGHTPHDTKGFLEKINSSICYINLNFQKEPKVFMGECGPILNCKKNYLFFGFQTSKNLVRHPKEERGLLTPTSPINQENLHSIALNRIELF